MGFVEHHQVPRRRFIEEDLRPVAPPHQVAGRDDDRLGMPRIGADGAPLAPPQGRGGVPDELPPVVDRPVQVELLAQLDLPLPEHRLRGQDQDPLRATGQPRLPQQQAGLDGLAQPHFVGDEQPRRPVRVEPLERPHLMRPGRDRGHGLADARALIGQRRRAVDEGPDPAAQIDCGRRDPIGRRVVRVGRRYDRGRRRWVRPVPQARRQIAVGHEAHQVAAHGLGGVEHDHPLRLVGPDASEVGLLVADALRLRPPARVDVDALPVVAPAGRGLVEAAVPREPVARPVRYDAGLLVEDAVLGNRPAFGVARHRHLHVEMAARHHPRQQLQRAGGDRIGRRQRQLGEMALDPLAQRRTAFDGFDLGRRQGAADHETHVAAVANQPLDAARGKCQRPGVEVAGQAVVPLRILKRRDVEQADQIAVIRGVLPPPRTPGEHPSALLAPQESTLRWRAGGP